MNIVILANADLASNYALNLLLPELKQHKLKLYLSGKVGKKSSTTDSTPEDLKQLKFFEQTLFNQILFPLLEKSTTNASFKTFKQFDVFLQQSAAKISSINSASILSEFEDFHTDLIISIRFGLILQDEVIACSRYGVINLHSGALPQLQGVMPTFRAMLKSDTEISTSLHFISNSQIDQGDIISTYSTALDTECSYLWNLLRLYEGGYKSIVIAVEELAATGKLDCTPQQGISEYFSFPKATELKQFTDQGFKLFDADEMLKIIALYTTNIA